MIHSDARFIATDLGGDLFDATLHGKWGNIGGYELRGVSRQVVEAAAEHLDVPVVWGESPSRLVRARRSVRRFMVGPKPWDDVLSELVSDGLTGVLLYGLFLLLGYSDAGVWAFAFAFGLFCRGTRGW